MPAYLSILDRIGNTPLVELRKLGRGLPVPVLVKCEHLNPGGSIKDRIALAIVEDAEERGVLRQRIHTDSSQETQFTSVFVPESSDSPYPASIG